MKKKIVMVLAAGFLLGASIIAKNFAAPAADDTETVLSTHRVKAGMENDYQQLLAQNWALLHKLGLVLDQPHLVLRGEEDGKTYFVEVLTWKDHEAADHVPPEVWAIWNKMNAATEARNGHQGIEFPEVHVVPVEK
jgi:hypothetical protein